MLENLFSELSLTNILLLDDDEQIIESHGPDTQALASANIISIVKTGLAQPIKVETDIYQPLQLTNRALLAEEQLSGSYLILSRIKDRFLIATAQNVDPGLLMFQLEKALRDLLSV
ncbi:MAG: hypothetical protein ACFFBD_28675 [Candidatus Hodarchaeota archaeon]